MPSRKTITALIFFTFLAVFFISIILYFGSAFFNSTRTVDVDQAGESRGFNFFPFGRGGTETETPFVPVNVSNGNGQNEIEGNISAEIQIDRLRQISTTPTAGGYVYARLEEDDSLFSSVPETIDVMRFVESSTGHVFETTGKTELVTRITNTTIPRIISAVFLNGERPILQYIDQASDRKKTFSAQVITPERNELIDSDDVTQSSRLSGIFLQDEILDLETSGDEVVYGVNTDDGFSLRKTDANGNEVVEVFNSPLSQWHIDTYGPNDVVVTHVPSFNSFGYAETVDLDSRASQKLYSGQLAMQIKPNADGSRSLISYWDGREMSLFILSGDNIIDTGLNTFAEKCVWSSDNVLAYCAEPLNDIEFGAPDSWYKGIVEYSDDFYQINTDLNVTSLLFSPFDEGNFSLDALDIALSANEKYLSFMDKASQTFWTYQLEL